MGKYLGRRKILPICGVYKIENLVNGKVYIGKSKNIGVRWSEHRSELNNGTHINPHLQSAWYKYGESNFRFDVIYKAIDEDDALKHEEYYIAKYKSYNSSFGYNLTKGGQSGYFTDESIANASKSKLGKYNDLSENDIKRIKMLAYCLMNLEEIADIYNVPLSTIRNIVYGTTYKHIFKEINSYIKNVKQQIIDDRNSQILDLYDKGYKLFEIRDLLNETQSIVEKCVYKYREFIHEKRDDSYDEEILDMYFNKKLSTIDISNMLPVSKPKIIETINIYKIKIGIAPTNFNRLDKGALFV